MLTIKEFYEWAVKNGIENCGFGIHTEDDNNIALENGLSLDEVETCAEINENDIEIGSYYGGDRITQEKFVWIYKSVGDC